VAFQSVGQGRIPDHILVCDTSGPYSWLSRLLLNSHESDTVDVKLHYRTLQNFAFAPLLRTDPTDSLIHLKVRVIEVRDYDEEKFALPQDQEDKTIASVFNSISGFSAARDPAGFYWLSPRRQARRLKRGDVLTVSYAGRFVDGTLFDRCSNFEFIYGEPDQLLPGLNYVIGRMGAGETVKIILPSRLAFGESGSSDGRIPPFTPLVYELTLTGIQSR
jgi:hypothetical protein